MKFIYKLLVQAYNLPLISLFKCKYYSSLHSDLFCYREAKYSGIQMEIDTFTMPIVDEIVTGDDGTVIREEQRMNSGILIKIIK